MIDLIIPVTDTPGAKAARVNEFMDLILTEWATEDERNRFLAGLNDMDVQSNALFGRKFIECTTLQQTRCCNLSTTRWIAAFALPSAVDFLRDYPCLQLRGEFFRSFKLMTLHGYYTSEIGMTQELKREIIPGAYHGCAPLVPEKKV